MTPKIYTPTAEEDAVITAAAMDDPDAQPLSDEELRSAMKATPEGDTKGFVAGLARATLEAEWAARGVRQRGDENAESAAAVLDRLADRLRKIAAEAGR